MKLELDYIFGNILDNIFSANTLFLIMLGGLGLVFYSLVAKTNENQEKLREITEYCYSQGMVVVDTDAGERCADPRSLVKVK